MQEKESCLISTMHNAARTNRTDERIVVTICNANKLKMNIFDQKARLYTTPIASRKPLAILFSILDKQP